MAGAMAAVRGLVAAAVAGQAALLRGRAPLSGAASMGFLPCSAGVRGIRVTGLPPSHQQQQQQQAGEKTKKRRRRKKKNEVLTGTSAALPNGFDSWDEVKEAIRAKAKELKLGPTHFAKSEPPRDDRWRAYVEWITKGMHGEVRTHARAHARAIHLPPLHNTRPPSSAKMNPCKH